ncbi:MAG: hypothetical protein ACRD13_07865 [Terriglobales bacterium]
MRTRVLTVLAVVCFTTGLALAQRPGAPTNPTVYIASQQNGFAAALTASFFKKNVPVTVVSKPDHATYQIKYTLTDQKGKPLAQALAFGLGGVGGFFVGRGSMNATVLVFKDGAVVYAYTVHKKGAGAVQKAAESFAKNWAKHLKKAK